MACSVSDSGGFRSLCEEGHLLTEDLEALKNLNFLRLSYCRPIIEFHPKTVSGSSDSEENIAVITLGTLTWPL